MSTIVPPASPTVGPRPLQLVDGNLPSVPNSPNCELSSPRSSLQGLSTPPVSRGLRTGNPRRQSSISYFPSDHVPLNDLRSPVGAKGKVSVRRSNSMGIRSEQGITGISRVKGDRRSLQNYRGAREPSSPAVDYGPLTLAEKHADLLHFIAQKESKCLELRSQLAVHENELAQLKRKWERIVSRGMDRAYSAQPATPTSAPPVAHPGTAVSSAIKGGVRILSGGLDLSESPTSSPSPLSSQPAMPPSVVASMSRSKPHPRHSVTLSISSASTSTSSSISGSQRLSQSSASSLMTSMSLAEFAEGENNVSGSFPIPEGAEDSACPIEISPSRATQTAKLSRRRSHEAQQASSPLSPSTTSSTASGRMKQDKRAVRTSSTATLPPASSTSVSGPLPSSPVSWMGSVGSSVGKKWEEIQRGPAFTKSQKRASVILSDVSQSIFAALSSPSANASTFPRNSPSGLTPVPSQSALSLLEDNEVEEGLGEVLVPSIVSLTPTPTTNHAQKKDADDDDDWNW